MAVSTPPGAVLIHPLGDFIGNLLWPGELPVDHLAALVWNASASAPFGLWRIQPGAPIRVGDMVLTRTPSNVRRLAAERYYLPANVPLLKRVAAAENDIVCAFGSRHRPRDRGRCSRPAPG